MKTGPVRSILAGAVIPVVCAWLLFLPSPACAGEISGKSVAGKASEPGKRQKKHTGSRQPFTPSEKISADRAVAFPVDI